MIFSTVEFAFFFPVVFLLYWFVFKRNLRTQNIFLIGASYFFYACWDWRFLGLIFLSSLIDYLVGKQLGKISDQALRKRWLFLSLVVNLGVLVYFKYANFFIGAFADTFTLFGTRLSGQTLNIILPVGISFYTFQTLSYTIDVYRNKMAPVQNAVPFFAYVSFFPQLVAGPIERATSLLPQFNKSRIFSNEKATQGLQLILIGLFKKMVIADNCAIAVNTIFDNYTDYNGSTLFFGAVFFAFQIYGDFSGYSDIAIGTAKLLGFDLMKNFDMPYLSRNMGEFWRRWHISLSTWFRDYVYIPLGGSKYGNLRHFRNILIVFLLSGLWHGANYTFVVWGLVHAFFFIPLVVFKKHKTYLNYHNTKLFPDIRTSIQILITFTLVCLAWVFFRATNITEALQYLNKIFSMSLLETPKVSRILVIGLFGYMVLEWIQRNKEHILVMPKLPKPLRYLVYYVIIFTVIYYSAETQPFIYFQF